MVRDSCILTCRRYLIVVALAVVSGCNTESASLTPVEGQVLLDGNPLPSGTIVTQPESGQGARGKISSDGRFTLETREVGPGAVPGMHRVGVVAYTSSDPNNPEAVSKSLVPEFYTNPFNSGLTINVQTGETNDFTLELSSKPKRR